MKRLGLLLISAVLASVAGLAAATEPDDGAFVSQFTDGPQGAEGLAWRAGDLFVSSHTSDNVIRFDGQNGHNKGPVTERHEVRLGDRRMDG